VLCRDSSRDLSPAPCVSSGNVALCSPKCTNMWGPWEDRQRKLLMLKCTSCGYMEQANNAKPVHENFVVKRLQ